jgi:hypothetical protein
VHPEPFRLSDLGSIDFKEIRATQERIMRAGKTLNTRRTYASSWGIFVNWCEVAGRSALPADPETVRDFATWCIMQGFA